MRTRTILIGALLLASAGLIQAQEQQQQTNGGAQTTATPASSFVPTLGSVDFGFRADNVDGDAARYNRFRDTRDGAFVDRFRFDRETVTTVFRAEANNVGYRDQRFFGEFRSIGRLKASFEWNQVPLFLGEDTRSLYTDRGNGVLEIADQVQANLQAATALGNAARDLAIRTALGGAAQYDLRSRRDVGSFDMVYMLNRDVDLKFSVQNSRRDGNQVFSFGFGTSPGLLPAVEIPLPMDDMTTDVRGSVEFASTKGLLALGYEGSWFDQNIPLVRFDNPMRAVDAINGASVGQMANWPANSSFAVNVNGSYKLPGRTRANAAISVGRWSQDEALPLPSVNTALVSPPLERATAQTQADIVSMVYTLNSRPIRNVWLNARYRYYDYANETPHFTARNAAIGDWNVTTQIHETEPASFTRHNVDLDASFTPFRYLGLGLGYGREDADRTFRIFEKTAEDVVRLTVDSTGNRYFTVRVKYEYGSRTGSSFDGHLLEEVGEQPTTRHYDIADRDRTRVTAMFSVTPASFISFNAAAGTGKDEYDATGFGLRDSENDNWSLGVDVTPVDKVSFGVNYTYDKYTAYQYSRTANPAPDATFTDPTRDWWLDQTDEVKTLTASVDFLKALPKTDIRLSYDLSDGDATYVYGLKPEQRVFTTTPLRQLAPVKNRLSGARADVQYFVRSNVALGVAYEFEEYKVDDFALGDQTINRLDPLNASNGLFASTIYTGYLFRPYRAHTTWLRMTYLW